MNNQASNNFTRDQRGAAMIEYVLLASLIALTVTMTLNIMSYRMLAPITKAAITIGTAGSIHPPTP